MLPMIPPVYVHFVKPELVAEVEFRDRRTRFRSLDELMTSRASLLNALRGLVVVADDLPRKRRNPLRIRYIRYARGY